MNFKPPNHKPMIKYKEYLEAQKIVDAYQLQLKQSVLKIGDLSINQKVKRNNRKSWWWVDEIHGDDLLIRKTENENDPKCEYMWVNIAEINCD